MNPSENARVRAILAAVEFVAAQPGGADRLLARHRRMPDGNCASCVATPTPWPCLTASIADRASRVSVAAAVHVAAAVPPLQETIMNKTIRTVAELISALRDYPPETRVLLAVQPDYPHAAAIGAVAHSPDDADMTGRGDPTASEPVVWIREGDQLGYLPGIARDALDMT